ncbi:MAG: undecaprenyldiphospho-muramoylpentapeptide beta-N-acetylglucosaminyltransferase [Legionellales bacterium]|nr:MAG: undecaprenyldiphospho-muramoylpentapeptide beta-N-acetylglucosaminyltransferase [Legionellales bacterium]
MTYCAGDKPKLAIAAGGTGGHIFPALAVAQLLSSENVCDVLWIGTKLGMEAQLINAHKIPISFISSYGLRGIKWYRLFLAPWQLIISLVQAIKILREQQPKVLLAMGGFVAGPCGLAARILGIPIIVHEQNALAGTTNSILAHFSTKVLQAFPDTFPKKIQAITTGNPIRMSICKQQNRTDFKLPLNILVVGGSRGAVIFNTIMPEALINIDANKFVVKHQTGAKNFQTTITAYKKNAVLVQLEEFIDDMAAAYKWADIVIARAGALTISELVVAKAPSILVPYPFAVDDHQTINAKYLSNNNAAILLPQQKFTVAKLASILQEFIDNPVRLRQLQLGINSLKTRDATAIVAKYCKEFL